MSRPGRLAPGSGPPPAQRLASCAATAPVREVLDAIAHRTVFITGGSVRDALLGRTSRDLDLSLDGSPEQVAATARRVGAMLGSRPHLVGRPPRAVWRVDGAALKVELWPLAGLTPTQDAWRRDLTVNAMLWQAPAGPLLDPTGGLADLRASRLRATSRHALADDPVRILRAVRFLAVLPGFTLDPPTAGWVRELAPTLAGSPRERVGHELALLSAAPRPDRGIAALLELGLLAPCSPPGAIPEPAFAANSLAAVGRLALPHDHPVPASARRHGQTAVLALLLCGLGATNGEAAASYAWDRTLCWEAVAAARRLESVEAAAGAPAARRRELIHALGEAFPAAFAAAAAFDTSPSAVALWRRWWRLWLRRGHELLALRPLLSSQAVAEAAGVAAGPELGRLLRVLTAAQVSGTVRTAGGALRLVRRLAAEAPDGNPPIC